MGTAAAFLLETFIYAHPDGPVTLQISADDITYYDMTLTSTMVLSDALQEWEDQANAYGAPLTGTFSFSLNSNTAQARLLCTSTVYYRGPADLYKLLGFSAEAMGSGTSVVSDTTVRGALAEDVDGAEGLGYELLRERGEVKPQRFRLGRAMVISHSHAVEVAFSCWMTASLFNTLRVGPLFRGKVRIHHSDGASAYASTDTTGYLDVFLSRAPPLELDGDTDTYGVVRCVGTLAEDADPSIPTAGSLEELTRGWSYGWGVCYAAKIEGLPYVFVEKDPPGTSAPSGYTVVRGLVVDGSAAVGAVIDRRAGLGGGYDLTMSFLDSGLGATGPTRQSTTDAALVRGIFKTPAAHTRLTATLADTEVATITVDDTTDFASSGTVYLGKEAIAYTGKTATTFTTLTRGAPSGDWRAYDHNVDSAIASYLTDTPQIWRGREVELYAVPVDPFGTVPGADLLAEAVLIWRGHVQAEPRRRSGLWQVPCRPYDRRLTEPLGAGVSGRASWQLDDDELVTIDDANLTLWATVTVRDATAGEYSYDGVEFQPFTAYTDGDTVKASTWRAAVVSSLTTASSSLGWAPGDDGNTITNTPTIDGFSWRKTFSGGQLTYILTLEMTPGAANQIAEFWCNVNSGLTPPQFVVIQPPPGPTMEVTLASTGDSYEVPSSATWATSVGIYTLAVVVEDGNTSTIPATGSVIVESDDQVSVFTYNNKTIEGKYVLLQLDTGQQPNLAPFAEDLIAGDVAEVSVRIGFLDEGALPDVLRRMLASSGRGDNDATYDTGAQGQGYDLAHVDHTSFDDQLGTAPWNDLTMSLIIDQDTSYADVFGGLLALGNKAVVTRWDGSDRRITCVETGLADTGYYVSTITDSDLVMTGAGGGSVKSLDSAYPRPNAIKLEVQSAPGVDDLSIVANDTQAQKAHGVEAWDVTTAGLLFAQAYNALEAWSHELLGLGLVRPQLAEINVHPGTVAEVGDLVRLTLTHPELWTYSTGLPGYTGPARVLGSRLGLTTGVKKLTVMIDGAHKRLALCPSEQITAFDGAYSPPTAPAWVEVRQAAYNLLKQWHDRSGNFDLAAYLPSSDRDDQRWTISAVTDTGSACRLTVDSQTGSFTATTSWYVAAPDSQVTTAAQDDHAHCDSDGWWV
jgi:hypothetical protein